MSARGIQQQGLLSGALTPASSIQALERRPQPSPGVPRAADPLSLSLLCTPGRRSVLGGCPSAPCGPAPALVPVPTWVGHHPALGRGLCLCFLALYSAPSAYWTLNKWLSLLWLLSASPLTSLALSFGLSALRNTQSTPAHSLCLKSGLEGERCPLSAHVEIAWEASKLLALKAVGCPEFSSPLEGFWGVGRLAADPSSSDDVNSLLRPAGM
ncbi:uncharacterized protein LOC121044062 [Herpailurus yagouaroundi]|uniref:uncharacterized protein LOC121044062 n=1 Tax=Herpailurus yagouaroundi TaxID=1608482 RepID=UPI001AD6A1DD|nr:uncharacterized protein LOC121044062 [Puma yagouaroundi]